MYQIIGTDGKLYGPIGVDEIRRWLAENRVHAQTLVQTEGAQDWKPLGSLPEFTAGLNAVPPPIIPASSAVAARASQKIAAGIFGILLGSLGIHKFILGYTGAGLIMLLVTVLSCFILSPVMHLIGFIEGIIYLCKPDEEFVRIYVDGRKEWF
jgi:TM2 domain-containing membrane protein YozV